MVFAPLSTYWLNALIRFMYNVTVYSTVEPIPSITQGIAAHGHSYIRYSTQVGLGTKPIYALNRTPRHRHYWHWQLQAKLCELLLAQPRQLQPRAGLFYLRIDISS